MRDRDSELPVERRRAGVCDMHGPAVRIGGDPSELGQARKESHSQRPAKMVTPFCPVETRPS